MVGLFAWISEAELVTLRKSTASASIAAPISRDHLISHSQLYGDQPFDFGLVGRKVEFAKLASSSCSDDVLRF